MALVEAGGGPGQLVFTRFSNWLQVRFSHNITTLSDDAVELS